MRRDGRGPMHHQMRIVDGRGQAGTLNRLDGRGNKDAGWEESPTWTKQEPEKSDRSDHRNGIYT